MKAFYVYWTMHHLDSWIKRDQLDVTCFIISLFNAQHVSDVSTGACDLFVELFHGLYCNTTHEITQQISRKLLRMDVLTSETCWALNNEIIKQVISSWSLFIQLIKHYLSNFKQFHYFQHDTYQSLCIQKSTSSGWAVRLLKTCRG